MIVRAAKSYDLAWLCDATDCILTPHARGIAAVDELGRTRGVIGYDYWTPNSVQAHMAVDSPIVWRSLLGPAFSYPFEEAGKNLLLGIIPSHNTRSAQMARRLGFRETHRVKDGWVRGDDLLVFEMRKDECRWLRRGAGKAVADV